MPFRENPKINKDVKGKIEIKLKITSL